MTQEAYQFTGTVTSNGLATGLMMSVLVSLLLVLRGCVRSRVAMQAEGLALGYQLRVLERSRRPQRLRLTRADRLLWGRRRRPASQTWRTFLANHVGQIGAADFLVVPTSGR